MQRVAVLMLVVLATGCAAAPEVIPPPCSQPGWLDGKFDPTAPGYIVTLADDVSDVVSVTQELARKYSIELDLTYQSAIKGFGVTALSPSALAELRCDPRVLGVSFNERIRM